MNGHQSVYFGGWNVRSCFHYSKQQVIAKQLKKYNIKVAALSETGIYDSGVKMLSEYTVIYSGLPSVNKARTAHGVAVCRNTEASRVWKNTGAEWEAVNERIIKIRMNCKPINVTIIAVYAPVNPSSTAASQSNDKFYSDLQDTLDKVSSSDMIIFMKDFNARIGSMEHNTSPQTVGPFATDSRTNNGERLVNFCVANNVVISNTFFNTNQFIKNHGCIREPRSDTR